MLQASSIWKKKRAFATAQFQTFWARAFSRVGGTSAVVSHLACVCSQELLSGDADGCDPAVALRYLGKIPAGKEDKFQEEDF